MWKLSVLSSQLFCKSTSILKLKGHFLQSLKGINSLETVERLGV
jgi:hypothetical protein